MRAAEVAPAADQTAVHGDGRFGLAARLRAWFDLTKPGITRMVLITTACAFYMAASPVDFILLLHTLVGTALAASGTNAMNQWVERDADRLMRRTRRRPVPSGRISSLEAFLVSGGMALFGTLYLIAFVNIASAALVALSFGSYIFVYTPLKRKTWLATVVGAVPGALPVLAGWAATGTPINGAAFALFAILFLWQMPHFYALAWMFREDYRDGGFKLLTVVDKTGRRAARQAMWYAAVLLPVSILPSVLGLTGNLYLGGATLLSVAFLLASSRFARAPERGARQLFMGSIMYLPLIFLLLVVNKTPL